jgi:hypothetical protein
VGCCVVILYTIHRFKYINNGIQKAREVTLLAVVKLERVKAWFNI